MYKYYSLIALLLLLSLKPYPSTEVAIVRDDFDLLAYAAETLLPDPLPYPIQCATTDYTIQIVWTTKALGTLPPNALPTATRMAQLVNGLFFRDGDALDETRLPAWKTDDHCTLDLLYITEGATFDLMENTKYLVIEPERTDYCGLAMVYDDDRPTADNDNTLSSIGWISGYCMGSYYIWAHETLHMLGAIQHSSPDSDGNWHSRYFDIMGKPTIKLCTRHDLIDCGHDGYFGLRHGTDSYLATHWNPALSPYLLSVPKYTLIFPFFPLIPQD